MLTPPMAPITSNTASFVIIVGSPLQSNASSVHLKSRLMISKLRSKFELV